MIPIEETADGLVLTLRVSPGASREGIVGERGEALKVAVSATAEKGKANKRLIRVLAEELDVPTRSIEIVSGQTSRDKRVLVRGIDRMSLVERLEERIART